MPNSMSLWGKSKNDSKCVKMTRHDANYQNSNIHSIAPLNLNTRDIYIHKNVYLCYKLDHGMFLIDMTHYYYP